jgi:hypothetical protein
MIRPFAVIIFFINEPCWESITACCKRRINLVPRVLRRQQWQDKNYPGSKGALSSSSILPALKSSKSGCPFEVGPVGLAPTITHMVVGTPRSYLAPRASTLACHHPTFSSLRPQNLDVIIPLRVLPCKKQYNNTTRCNIHRFAQSCP